MGLRDPLTIAIGVAIALPVPWRKLGTGAPRRVGRSVTALRAD